MTQSRSDTVSANQWPAPDNSLLIDWISERTGLAFRSQRHTASNIISEYMQRAGLKTPRQCRERLESDQAAFDDLIGELTIGETYFYRDEKQFDLIAGEFLDGMKTIRPDDHRLRFWSAGCASGEEAWTLAAVLSEAGLSSRSHILGTDISRTSLARARAGEYGVWSLRGTAGERMRKWGTHSDRKFEVAERLRSMVSFEYLNLAADQYPSFASKTNGLDLILCRNVLIYFNAETIQAVASRLYRCLAPGGWLITGVSDRSLADYAPFEVLMRDCGQVYVRPDPYATLPSLQTQSSSDQLHSPPERSLTPGTISQPHQAETAPPPPPVPPSASHPINETQPRRGQIEKVSVIETVERALARGDYSRVLELTDEQTSSTQCCILRVRALANLDTEQAEVFCRAAVDQHKVSVELHYLHSILLAELDRHADAVAAARNAVFLDQKLIVGHLALGSALEQLGNVDHARRSFRNAKSLSENWSEDEPIPCSDGESADRLAESAARHLALLEPDDQSSHY